jgi:hypothetical protein
VADYTGSRRATEPMSAASAAHAFAEDDAALVCPECGAGVRPGQEWCTLCLHVLRKPEPHLAPGPAAEPAAEPAPERAAEPAREPAAEPAREPAAEAAPVSSGPSDEARARAEAAAEALLAQLSVETRHQRLNVPEYLNSKARITMFVPMAMAALCGLGIAVLAVLGAIFR